LPLVVPPSFHLIVPAGCRIASCHHLIVTPSRQLIAPACCCIASPHPLIALPSRHLVPPAGCRIASCRPLLRHPLVNSSHQLVVASPLLILSLRPVPPSCPLVAPSGCCVASQCATLLSSCCLVDLPLIASSRQLVVAPSSLAVLSLHCPLVLSSCWLVVALPVLVPPSRPLAVVHCRRHQTLSNAAAAIEHHRHRRH